MLCFLECLLVTPRKNVWQHEEWRHHILSSPYFPLTVSLWLRQWTLQTGTSANHFLVSLVILRDKILCAPIDAENFTSILWPHWYKNCFLRVEELTITKKRSLMLPQSQQRYNLLVLGQVYCSKLALQHKPPKDQMPRKQ